MKALITGSRGLIGRRVWSLLRDAGHDTTGWDIIDGTDVRVMTRDDERHFDLVVHCAAVVGGRAMVESPLAHAANLEIDASLFQWAERVRPGRIVYLSSCAAYPIALTDHTLEVPWGQFATQPPPYEPLREDQISWDMISLPDQLYGWEKLTGELLASRSSVPVTVVRPFAVYGENQNEAHPISAFARQILNRADPVEIWGPGTQLRDFIHVDDVANAILAIAAQGAEGPVNICTGRAAFLAEIVKMLAYEEGYKPAIKTLPDMPAGVPYYVGNTEKLQQFYQPQISLESGLRRVLEEMR